MPASWPNSYRPIRRTSTRVSANSSAIESAASSDWATRARVFRSVSFSFRIRRKSCEVNPRVESSGWGAAGGFGMAGES